LRFSFVMNGKAVSFSEMYHITFVPGLQGKKAIKKGP